MKKGVKNGANGKEKAKKHNMTNEDLVKRADQQFSRMDTKFSALSKQIELVASAVLDVNELVQDAQIKLEREVGLLKSEVKGVESRLGQKLDHVTNRLDDVVLNYEKKEAHHKDIQKVSGKIAAIEQKLTHE